eukprot:gnl/Spiro4/12794_TR6778_c0_g1_i1.p1 gnl/Spiro4/12794_TR6778_c0_g1~~gnl/Spiro4/12794_TR6778_c0_g1_i1.p1  ORF type:complete len:542 (-),score=-137.95 gnl/Spiro4/12794_TR6778_c0_g1_i1:292-1917(-)
MKKILHLLVSLILIKFTTTQVQNAICVFFPTINNPSTNGTLFLSYDSNLNTTNVTGIIQGFAPNTYHGLHVHIRGDVSAPDGTASGLHWNPYNAIHGALNGTNQTSRHAGDLGNVFADQNGNIQVSVSSNLLLLQGNNSAIGRTMIIHQNPDDGITQPTGNSGLRYGQCVIGIQNVANNVADNEGSVGFGVCELIPAAGYNISGRVVFYENAGILTVRAVVCNAPTGNTNSRGFHIHQFGDLSLDYVTKTGGHYNPYSNVHSSLVNPNRHSGDLGNFTLLSNGNGLLVATTNLSLLSGVNSIIGRAIILHSSYDDGVTQPTGNSGSRIASCIVGWTDSLKNDYQCNCTSSGYSGNTCNIPICYGFNSSDPNSCSGNGTCISPNTCSCQNGYTGNTCNLPICFGFNSSDPNSCSGNGTCISPNTCSCQNGYTGNTCNLPICFGFNSTDPNACSGNGTCVSPNICNCFSGFFGIQCLQINFTCSGLSPNNTNVCSGNGACASQNNCICKTGFFGLNCEFVRQNNSFLQRFNIFLLFIALIIFN